jgi:hypothetical protein
VGKIIDFDRFNKFMRAHPGIERDIKIVSIKTLLEGKYYGGSVINNKITVTSFNDTEVSLDLDVYNKTDHLGENWPERAKLLLSEIDDTENIFIWHFTGNEEDGAFCDYNEDSGEYSEIDYDISLDFFSPNIKDFYTKLPDEKKSGVTLVELEYGAERNG